MLPYVNRHVRQKSRSNFFVNGAALLDIRPGLTGYMGKFPLILRLVVSTISHKVIGSDLTLPVRRAAGYSTANSDICTCDFRLAPVPTNTVRLTQS